MTNEELATMALAHQDRLAAMAKWSESVDRRIGRLEEQQNTLTEVQVTLVKLDSATERIGEKVVDMKKSLDKISEDNKNRHDELSKRVRTMEDAPAQKWDKAVWLIITALIGAAVGYFLKAPLP